MPVIATKFLEWSFFKLNHNNNNKLKIEADERQLQETEQFPYL